MRTARAIAGVVIATVCLLASPIASAESIGWTLMPEWAPPPDGAHLGAADLDGDGDHDLLGSQLYTGLRNDGGCDVGQWSYCEAWVDGLQSADCVGSMLDLADLDADGDADLLMGCFYGSVLFYENTGTSLEPTWTRNDDYFFTYSYSDMFRGPSAADLDGDGDLDVVASTYAGTSHMIVYWNEGTPADPSWVEDRDFFSGLSPAGTSVDPNFADLDLDGDLDLITLPVSPPDWAHPGVYENVGSATSPVWEENPGLLTGVAQERSYQGGVLQDLNCDGRPDLIMDVYGGLRLCYRNDGPTTAVEQTSWGLIKSLYR